jgi:hypothetical protein
MKIPAGKAAGLPGTRNTAKLIKGFFATPKYRNKFTGFVFNQFFMQLHWIRVSGLSPMENPVIGNIDRYYPKESKAYRNAVQYKRNITFNKINFIQNITISLSAILVLAISLILLFRKKYPPLLFYSLLMAVYLLGNAFVCAAFSTVVGRYQGRLTWLIPMFLICFLADKNVRDYLLKRKSHGA